MTSARWLCLFFVVSVAAVSGAGDIQIFCEAGLRVYLDDELVGISNRMDDGLFLLDIHGGTHSVRVERDGFQPQSFEVNIGQVPIEITVGEFSSLPPNPREETAPASTAVQQHGSLTVTSAPQNCVVEIDGKPQTKTTPQLTIGGLVAGEHTITFSKPGYESVTHVVRVSPGAEVSLRGNLKESKVEVFHQGKGSLRVFCKPSRCTVRFLGVTRDPSGGMVNLSYIPAGEHRLVVSIPGRELATDVFIANEQRTIVEVSFMKGDEPFVVSRVPR